MNEPNGFNTISKKWNAIFTAALICVALVVVIPVILMIIVSFSSKESITNVGYSFFSGGMVSGRL